MTSDKWWCLCPGQTSKLCLCLNASLKPQTLFCPVLHCGILHSLHFSIVVYVHILFDHWTLWKPSVSKRCPSIFMWVLSIAAKFAVSCILMWVALTEIAACTPLLCCNNMIDKLKLVLEQRKQIWASRWDGKLRGKRDERQFQDDRSGWHSLRWSLMRWGMVALPDKLDLYCPS